VGSPTVPDAVPPETLAAVPEPVMETGLPLVYARVKSPAEVPKEDVVTSEATGTLPDVRINEAAHMLIRALASATAVDAAEFLASVVRLIYLGTATAAKIPRIIRTAMISTRVKPSSFLSAFIFIISSFPFYVIINLKFFSFFVNCKVTIRKS